MHPDTRAAVARHLRAHHGVITHAKAQRLGVSEIDIRQLLASGHWARRHRGVYSLGDVPVTPLVVLSAAVAAAGPDAVVSHQSAAWLWRLTETPPVVPEVTVPLRRNPKGATVTFHRSSRPLSSQVCRGLPCTSALRTLFDTAPDVGALRLADLIDRGLAARLFTLRDLAEAARPNPRNRQEGRQLIRQALVDRGYLGGPTPSVLESRMGRLVRRHGLPVPAAEVRWGPSGEYRLDFVYQDRCLVIEVDGYAWHHSPSQQQRDHARRRKLSGAGWTVLVYTWKDVDNAPEVTAAEIQAVYRRLAPVPSSSSTSSPASPS